MSVLAEGLLTQLVFEHSLRIRLKAETSNDEEIEQGKYYCAIGIRPQF
jgi:hypothetical protein